MKPICLATLHETVLDLIYKSVTTNWFSKDEGNWWE